MEVLAAPVLLLAHNYHWWKAIPGLSATWQPWLRYGVPVVLVAVVLVSFVRMKEDMGFMGIHPRTWSAGWRSIAVFTALGLILIVLLGMRLGEFRFQWGWLRNYIHLMVIQEITLNVFFNNRLYYLGQGLGEGTRNWLAVVGATLVFALLHTPNPYLTLGVLFTGLFWAWHFRRHHNLPAVIVSHLVLGTTAMFWLGNGPLLRLRVGLPALDLMR